MNRRSRAGWARRPWLVVLAVATPLIGLVAWRAYRAIDRDLTQAILSRRASVAFLAAATLTEKLDRLSDLGVSLATRVRFRALVEAGQWSEAIEILRRVPQDFPVIDRLFLADTAGTLKADIPAVPAVRGQSFAHRDWYRGVSRAWTPYVSNVYTRAAAPVANVAAIAAPITGSGDRVTGILVLQVRLEAILGWTREIDIGEQGIVYVVDRDGTLATHSGRPPEGAVADYSAAPGVQQVLRGAAGVDVLVDSSGTDLLVAYHPIPRYGWGVVAQQPAAVAFATRNALMRGVVLAYVLLLALFLAALFLVARIVTERQQARAAQEAAAELEQRVAERTAQLDAANKEMESFSYSVSHDLRAPLRAIDGFSRMLEEDSKADLSEEAYRRLRVIRQQAVKMGQLIDDLLDFSRLGRKAIALRRIEMTALVEQVYHEVAASSGDGSARLVVIEPLPPAHGDPALISRVWANLLSNAIKFTSRRPDPRITVSGTVDGAEAVYCVKDNGAGFDPAYRDKLFGVFQRLHGAEEFPGTGVGLAIVHRVVGRHNGRVWADGAPDQGATFWFTLPAAPLARPSGGS